MNPLKYLFNWFLNKSKSYNYYKDNYYLLIKKHEKDLVEIQKLNNQVNNIKKKNKSNNEKIAFLKEINNDYKNQLKTLYELYENNNSDLNELKNQNNQLKTSITHLSKTITDTNNKSKGYNDSCIEHLNHESAKIIDKINSNTSKTITQTKDLNKSMIEQIKDSEKNINVTIANANKNMENSFNNKTDKLINENSKNISKLNSINENINKNHDKLNHINKSITYHNNNLLKYLDDNLDLDKIDIINHISEELHNNNFTNINAYKEINKMNLFNERYYKKEYTYNSDIDPLLHYIYKGYKENKNPSPTFDNVFYKNSNEEIQQSNLNPLVYFVSKGFKEGNILFNPTVMNVKHINKYELDEKITNFKSFGVKKRKRKTKIIVSLTSYPERMYDIHYCIYSLLNQEIKPDKVILWLAYEEFPDGELDIPKEVLKLKNNGLTIKFCENIKSYKKSIPTLKEYPNDILVTADDDVYYPSDWLKNMYEEHKKNPRCIIGLRSRQMLLNDEYEFLDYDKWKLADEEKEESYLNFMTGSGGVLYPPHCFFKDVLKKDIFLKIAEDGDDLWLWAMAIMNKTKYKVPSKRYNRLIFINPARERLLINESTLWSLNINENQNNKQLKKIIEKYPTIMRIIKEDIG